MCQTRFIAISVAAVNQVATGCLIEKAGYLAVFDCRSVLFLHFPQVADSSPQLRPEGAVTLTFLSRYFHPLGA